MHKVLRNAVIAVVVAASFYATYNYPYGSGRQRGFNDGLTEGKLWTFQQMSSTIMIVPGQNLSYLVQPEALQFLVESHGNYIGLIHFGFAIGEMNETTNKVNWGKDSEVAIEIIFQTGPYVVSTGWINDTNGSAEVGLSFSLPVNYTVHYATYLLISASGSNGHPTELFFTTPFSLWS